MGARRRIPHACRIWPHSWRQRGFDAAMCTAGGRLVDEIVTADSVRGALRSGPPVGDEGFHTAADEFDAWSGRPLRVGPQK